MAQLARDYSVEWGTLLIGGANEELAIDGPVLVRTENDRVTVSCTVILRPTIDTDAEFNALETAVKEAMRVPRLRLQIKVGAETLHDYNPAAGVNTSGNAMPTYEEPGDVATDSRRGRLLQLSWSADLNATPYGQDGRRDSQVTVTYTAGEIITITIAGEYRADDSFDNARDRYEASIPAFRTAVLAPFVSAGLVFERLGRQPTVDDTNFICTFSEEHREIIQNQAVGVRDFPSIKNPTLVYRRNLNEPGDSPGVTVNRLRTVTVNYRSEVTKDNLDLVGLWRNTIRPLIILGAQARWPGGVAILDETYGPSVYDNVIEGSMTLLISSGGGILSYELTWTTTDDPGEVEDELGTTGEFDVFVYQGNRKFVLQLQSTTRYLELISAPDDPSSSRPPGANAGAGGAGAGGGDGVAQGIQIAYRRNEGQTFSRALWDLTPGGPTSATAEGGDAAAQATDAAQGEWSKPIIVRTATPKLIGQPGYQLPVTDETVTVTRRWRVPYQAPPVLDNITGNDSSSINDQAAPGT